jgi:thioredoxin-like negative regulator of GroEL
MKEQQAFKPVWFLFAVLIALTAITAISRLREPHEIIPWREDLAAAQKESAATRKPMMLYLTAQWCGPCQSLRGTTWADAGVERALRDYVPVKVDIDQHAEIARQYGGDAIPRFVVIDPAGTIVKATEGARPPDEFLAWLRGI